MKPSEIIASFVAEFSNQAIPTEAVERVKAAIMDYTGVTLYGVDEESSQIVRQIIDTFGGNPRPRYGYRC